ncbi:MAG: pyridoxamine 5'-phosphate oxidase [Pelagibacteraceae bacterium]|jgi:pyridoxamine 5'-phosphate oxidase
MSDKNLNPIILFEEWFNLASQKEINDPNAMCLSTISNDSPHSRMVLLKDFDDNGFVFYTNYESNKGKDIQSNPNVCLNFHWKSLLRQVRIEGQIEKVSSVTSDNYFNSRHYLSRVGAWASNQSSVLESRELLERKIEEIKLKYPEGSAFPRPDYWGGFIVKPLKIEFWQDMPHRIHKREIYELKNGSWIYYNLYP